MNSKRRQIIFDTLIKHVAKYGTFEFSTKQLSAEAGLAEGLIFYYFKTKQGMIDECAAEYDRSLMNYCTEMAAKGATIYSVWDVLFDELLKRPDGAIFYFDYVNYFGFNPTENNKRAAEYLSAARILLNGKENLDDHKILVLWDYITTQLLYYVNKIAKNEMEDGEEERKFIKVLAFSGYEGAK